MEITQPWKDEALQLQQQVDGKLPELCQQEEATLKKTVGPITKEVLEEVHSHENNVAKVLQKLNTTYNNIATNIKGKETK